MPALLLVVLVFSRRENTNTTSSLSLSLCPNNKKADLCGQDRARVHHPTEKHSRSARAGGSAVRVREGEREGKKRERREKGERKAEP
jgi:hypothetical protein